MDASRSSATAGQRDEAPTPGRCADPTPGAVDAEVRVSLSEERLRVEKRQVETGRVTVRKTVREEHLVVDEPLLAEEVTVERVRVGRVVDGPIAPRHEGPTLVVSMVEEEVVVIKRFVLREEIRLTTRRAEVRRPQHVTLRREEASVERSGGGAAAGADTGGAGR